MFTARELRKLGRHSTNASWTAIDYGQSNRMRRILNRFASPARTDDAAQKPHSRSKNFGHFNPTSNIALGMEPRSREV
jgi:hypothetical protein